MVNRLLHNKDTKAIIRLIEEDEVPVLRECGIQIGDTIFCERSLGVVNIEGELPQEIEVLKYCYDEVEDRYYKNPNYVEPQKPMNVQDEILKLKSSLQKLILGSLM